MNNQSSTLTVSLDPYSQYKYHIKRIMDLQIHSELKDFKKNCLTEMSETTFYKYINAQQSEATKNMKPSVAKIFAKYLKVSLAEIYKDF